MSLIEKIKSYFGFNNDEESIDDDLDDENPLLSKEEKYPRKNVSELNGYKLTVYCTGVYTQTPIGRGAEGDPKGYVTLTGHGINVSTKNDNMFLDDDNLKWKRETLRSLRNEIINKYNKDVKWEMLNELADKAFAPYEPHDLG